MATDALIPPPEKEAAQLEDKYFAQKDQEALARLSSNQEIKEEEDFERLERSRRHLVTTSGRRPGCHSGGCKS